MLLMLNNVSHGCNAKAVMCSIVLEQLVPWNESLRTFLQADSSVMRSPTPMCITRSHPSAKIKKYSST